MSNKNNTPSNPNKLLSISMNNHKVPDFVEKTNAEWVYYGANNNYPDYLLRCYNRSAKHNAIVNQKVAYICGAGFKGDDKIVNEENETFGDIVKKTVLDYVLFGGLGLEIIKSKGGNKAFLHHVDFSRIRSDKYNETFFYSEKWAYEVEGKYYPINNQEVKGTKYDFQTYEPFSTGAKGKSLYYFKSYRPALDTYPLPDYLGAIGYIELDYEIMNYWYNAVKYGFTPSHLITFFNGVPIPEEQKKVEDSILSKFTTTDGRKLILNFAESKESGGSEVTKLEHEDLDKQFQILNKTTEQEIYAGHRVNNPMLMGIKTEGQLGGRNELIEANELFQSVYVTPIQKQISKALEPLTKLMGMATIEFNKVEPIGIDLINSTNGWALLTDDEKRIKIGKEPIVKDKKSVEAERIISNINSLSQLVANEVMKSLTTNEIRGLVGLPPIKGGDKIPSTEPTQPPKDVQLKREKPIDAYKKNRVVRHGTFVKSRPLKDFKNVKESEEKFIGEKFATLKDNQLSVLDLLDKDPKMTSQSIADILKLPVQKVNGIIAGLKDKDLIKDTPKGLIITPNAVKILEDTEAPTASIFVVYSYEWIEGFTDADKDTSREFCLELLAESEDRKATNSLWTRQELEAMSNEMEDGYADNVWENRGGWYTKPGTDIHVPHCRHQWVQNIYINE